MKFNSLWITQPINFSRCTGLKIYTNQNVHPIYKWRRVCRFVNGLRLDLKDLWINELELELYVNFSTNIVYYAWVDWAFYFFFDQTASEIARSIYATVFVTTTKASRQSYLSFFLLMLNLWVSDPATLNSGLDWGTGLSARTIMQIIHVQYSNGSQDALYVIFYIMAVSETKRCKYMQNM